MNAGRTYIVIFQKMRIKNLKGFSEVRLKKTQLLHLGNVEKPPHSQLSAQRACEGQAMHFLVSPYSDIERDLPETFFA